tara:strand:+ start:9471 stop:9740 length:270 start_codon:yes stop_codon:yes gene_type:complete
LNTNIDLRYLGWLYANGSLAVSRGCSINQNGRMFIVNETYKPSELATARRLCVLIRGGWPLEQADRDGLEKILKEWIGVLEEEQEEGAP